ncbi:MAG: M13 family metallopeptidase [Prevotellaceae bacterium]|jgi:putative endopeptidase|nr:M13 family metallopeptidase [Prevotellaceae bacterium]
MKRKLYVSSIIALTLMMAGCNNVTKAPLGAGIQLANLDTTVSPGTDFYEYACGGWIKSHPLSSEYARFGSFDYLAEENRKQLRGIIEELSRGQYPDTTLQYKIGLLYKMAMDETKLDGDGVEPIMPLLARIASIDTRTELIRMIGQMHSMGMRPFFGFYIGADDKNSVMNIAHVSQGGLGMGNRDYYLEEDDRSRLIRNKYDELIHKLFGLSGFDGDVIVQARTDIMDLETRIAKASRSRVEMRDPQRNYNKLTLQEMGKYTKTFDWNAYFAGLGITPPADMNVGQPEVLAVIADLIMTQPIVKLKNYLQWNLIRSSASFLSDDFVMASFNFFGKTLTGREELQPRWKRAVEAVDGALGEAVGQIYVEKYFPPAAKERMTQLVHNLQTALGERIQNLEWMSEETKTKALEKLGTFYVKIGYPDKWKDYSGLMFENDSYWANMMRATMFEVHDMLSRLGKPVDKDEWGMTPQTVNAYYNPSTNEICFPAGILQYPFFDMNADDAFNYGAIGVVIGHEMTHGFDDQGRQFDKDGNLKDWWTTADADKFTQRAQVMIDFFDKIEVAPGVQADGKLTLGENIADYGGLQVSFQAFKNATKDNPLPDKLGFTPEQRFFIAYAGVWAANIRAAEVLRRTKNDVHSLGEWRVNGALPQIGAWYDAFHITAKDPMFVPVEKRVSIW